MPKKYPPLTWEEIIAILKSWGFQLDRQAGSHQQWKKTYQDRPYLVTVDEHQSPFDGNLIQKMIRQSGLSREQFYSGCKSSARKINVEPRKTSK